MRLSAEGLKDRAKWEEAGYALPKFDREAMKAATRECPQWVQRQRVVDLLVVPFFFVLLPHSGQLGRLVVIL